MVDEVAVLSVRLEATTAKFDKAMVRSTRRMDSAARKMERRAGKMDKKLANVGSSFGININASAIVATAAIATVGKAIADVVKNGDKLKLVEGRFKALTGSAERAGTLLKSAFEIGDETGADFDAITTGLTRFTIAAEAIEATDAEVVQLTQNMLKLGQIGGGSAQEITSGTVQLGQALAKGTLDGQELKSIMENLPLVAKAIAEGFGVGIGKLKEMGAAGELTSRKVFDALLSKTDEVNAQFAQLPETVGRSAGRMANAWTKFTAEVDRSLGLTNLLAAAANNAAGNIQNMAAALDDSNDAGSEQATDVVRLGEAVQRLESSIEKMRANGEIDSVIGRAAIADLATVQEELSAILELQGDIARAATAAAVVPGTSRGPQRRGTVGGAGGSGQVDVLPAKFAPPKRAEFIDNPFGGGGGGGGGSTAVDTQAVRMLDAITQRIKLLDEEQRLTGLSTVAQAELSAEFERQRILREFNTAAARDNAEITPAMIAQAEELAQTFKDESIALAVLTDVLEAETEAQEDAAKAAEDTKRAIESIGNSITGAIQQADSFSDALKNVALQLLNIAAQGLGGAGPLGGVLGGVISAAFGAAGGGGSTSGAGLAPAIVPGAASAKGNAFSGGKIIPFARGGIVNSPTMFPMKKGAGLMGEAGPEAILPLSRGPGGKLGVQGGGSDVTVQIINNSQAEVTDEGESTGPNGEQVRKFIIEEVQKATGRGDLDQQQRNRFGISPQRIKR